MMWFYQLQARLGKRLFPERANRWRRWKRHDPMSSVVISHERWNAFLSAYVTSGADGVNRVRYAAVAERDRAALSTYLADCGGLAISTYARDEQYAYWLNVYNAITVRTVLEHYPIRSMRNAGLVPSWLGGGPWDHPRVRVEDELLSLNDIEHRILRRNWRDPRIHYAINCGAMGCPNLPRQAFGAEGLDRTLDTLATAFINSPRGVHFDGNRLSACRIFSWFREDFGGSDAALLEHLQRYAAPELRDRLKRRTRIDGYHYDWSLNDAKG
ncbi:MAG: DUF547 domain-containing protein [Betaproteobacteria bacterium]